MTERYPPQLEAITFATVVIMGAPTLLLTLFRNLYVYYALSFIYGLGMGAVWTSAYIVYLAVWRGRDDGDAAMHAVQFGFSVGTVVGPLLAAKALQYHNGKAMITSNQRKSLYGPASMTMILYMIRIVRWA